MYLSAPSARHAFGDLDEGGHEQRRDKRPDAARV